MIRIHVISILVSLVVAYLSYWILSYTFSRGINQSTNLDLAVLSKKYENITVRKDGILFISDGARFSARESAVELAKHGYHVLIGLQSDAEIRSFAYEQRKGIELINFDLTDPSTFPPLIYRLRQIRRDLDRELVGVIVNLLDQPRHDSKFLDIDQLDRNYKAWLKGPVRLLQALFGLIEHQNLEGEESYNLEKKLNMNGFRITSMIPVSMKSEDKLSEASLQTNLDTSCKEKGSSSVFLSAYQQFLLTFQASQQYYNFTVSSVMIPQKSLPSIDTLFEEKDSWSPNSPKHEKELKDRLLKRRWEGIEEYLSSKVDFLNIYGDKKNDNDQIYEEKSSVDTKSSSQSKAIRAVLHSFLSKNPLESYENI